MKTHKLVRTQIAELEEAEVDAEDKDCFMVNSTGEHEQLDLRASSVQKCEGAVAVASSPVTPIERSQDIKSAEKAID